MQYEYDYDWMTLSSGQSLERLLLAQVLREVHFLGPRCTVQVHYLGQVHLPGP